jgi:hypothetical protein
MLGQRLRLCQSGALLRLNVAARPGEEQASTSQGHPRTIFRRALEHNNLVLAEVTAREIGRVTIAGALELTALVARKQPDRYGRFPPAGSASGSKSTRGRRSKRSRCWSRTCTPSRGLKKGHAEGLRPRDRGHPCVRAT